MNDILKGGRKRQVQSSHLKKWTPSALEVGQVALNISSCIIFFLLKFPQLSKWCHRLPNCMPINSIAVLDFPISPPVIFYFQNMPFWSRHVIGPIISTLPVSTATTLSQGSSCRVYYTLASFMLPSMLRSLSDLSKISDKIIGVEFDSQIPQCTDLRKGM